ncbi:hypothetical protein [Colwellia sp. Bg11-12]|uniref:hypothetical protein n=1 Tax=Colwellia sp. Bg11-12 TaxID=2759817 RepID=UPI0015F3F368|nr:hypothetical protein [Colwellia sp. Bg11-12]MBA6262205.1 hypothetical protein [Colwellia sp. Bg11-12]
MKKILKTIGLFVATGATYAAVLRLLEGVFKYDSAFLLSNPAYVHLFIIILLGCIASLCNFEKVIDYTKDNINIRLRPTSLSIAIRKETKLLLKTKKYHSIIRLRAALSRYFWLEGKLVERISLGEAAEEAAIYVGDFISQVACLIDDIGWTKVVGKDYQGAKKAINHGLTKAVTLNEYYWVAKAHRHLAGVYALESNQPQSTIEMNNAKKYATKITEDSKKKEVLAGIEYANVMNLLVIGDLNLLPEMEESIKLAQKIYEELDDQTRLIKLHALRGKMALKQGQHLPAKDFFHRGLDESERIGRKDEMIRNLNGLSDVYMALEEKSKATAYINRAKLLCAETPVPFELDEIVKN